jgi:hypothetical protein
MCESSGLERLDLMGLREVPKVPFSFLFRLRVSRITFPQY